MLDLSTENKALCFEDSTKKPLYIFLYYRQASDGGESGGYWRYFTTIENAIVLESAEITEGALEGNNFELGSLVVPSMKVQWQNNGIRYKDMLAVPVQQIGAEYIAYFDGYISSEEISQNGQTVTAEIVSFLGERLDVDVSEILKGWDNGGTYEATFDDTVYNALAQVAGIVIKDVSLLNKFRNASQIIHFNQSTFPNTLTAKELLKQAGEFLGAHIVVKEKRVVDIDDMTTYEPFGTPIIDFIRFSNVDTVAQSNTKPLPSGYKRVEYIQTNGTQYINTGYIPTSDTSIEMQFYNFADYLDVSNPANPTLHTTALFGARTSQTTKSYSLFASVNKLNEFVFDISNSRVVIDQTPLYKQKISTQTDKITINGITKLINVASLDCEYPLYLFSVNTAGSFDERCALGKLYSFKIYENNILQRDMTPCVRLEDSVAGLYDLVNGSFYTNEGMGEFIAPNPIETYTLPYYINLYVDKANRVQFDQIRVVTKTGEMLNYQQWWNDPVKTTYEIKNNIFFEALSTQNWEQCQNAVREVGSYLENQNLHYADLQTVYPPFIEGGDYLIVKSKNQTKLPNEYLPLESINLGKASRINTGIVPNSDDIEINIEFMALGGYSGIFDANGSFVGQDTVSLAINGNSLYCQIGYYGGSIQQTAFVIPYVPNNTKIELNIKCGKGDCQYNGTFEGEGGYFGGDEIYTFEPLYLGAMDTLSKGYNLYHFAYSQSGVKLCDMYPCMRESDGAIGVYDIVKNVFKVVQGNPSPNYESGNTVIPVLSATARGIHSMRADILCKATNSNKN